MPEGFNNAEQDVEPTWSRDLSGSHVLLIITVSVGVFVLITVHVSVLCTVCVSECLIFTLRVSVFIDY